MQGSSTSARVSAQAAALRGLVAGLDADAVALAEAADVWSGLDQIERLAGAAKVLVARRVEEAPVWQQAGCRSAAEWIARKSGCSVHGARAALRASKRLGALPAIDAALRAGELSVAQAELIADAATADPSKEQHLVDQAGRLSLRELAEECGRIKAAADPDPDATFRRIHANRRLRTGTNSEGAWWLSAQGTVVDGALLDHVLAPLIDELYDQARAEGRHEHRDTYAYDALFELFRRYLDTDEDEDLDDETGDLEDTDEDGEHDANGEVDETDDIDEDEDEELDDDDGEDGYDGTDDLVDEDRSEHDGDAGDDLDDEADGRHVEEDVDEDEYDGDGDLVDEHDGGDRDAAARAWDSHDGEDLAPEVAQPSRVDDSEADAPDHAGHSVGEADADQETADRPGGLDDADPNATLDAPTHPMDPEPDGDGDVGLRLPGLGPDTMAKPAGSAAKTKTAKRNNRKKARQGRRRKRSRDNPRYLGLLRIDLEALTRGEVHDGETVEISGLGPIPVSQARRLLGESVLKLVITRGVDVLNVTHLGRGATIAQRIALLWTSPSCSNEACPHRLTQIDHRVPWAQTHHTTLRELDHLCGWDHWLKTHRGWSLVDGTGRRAFVNPNDPRHPKHTNKQNKQNKQKEKPTAA